jgi:uncharacterized OsmC-like protein
LTLAFDQGDQRAALNGVNGDPMGSYSTKQWSVNVIAQGQKSLRYFCDGRPLTQSAAGTIDDVCPVEHLLMAVAGCFALSCRAILVQRRLSTISLEIVATAAKERSALNQLSKVTVVAIFRGNLSPSEANEISDQARPLCTVSNTVSSFPHIDYRSRTSRETHTYANDFQAQFAGH